MRSSKIGRVLIGTILCLFLLNQALTFLLEPAQSSSSDNMWYGYQNQEELDTIFAGSSLVSRSLDPDRYDRRMETHSCNMGTNAQMFAQSYTAIETAWREHQVKNVILGIGYFEFQSRQGLGNEVAFYRARNHYSSMAERVRNDLRYVLDADNFGSSVSVNYFFPWVYDHVTVSVKEIAENLQQKLTSDPSEQRGEPGNGFSNGDTSQLDFNTLSYADTSSAQSQKEVQPAYDELKKICDFCRQKGICLYVINMPLPEYYVAAFPEQYFERGDRIRRTCEEHGAAYYDFNLSRPELFERRDSYYMDFEHMNQEGAEAFTDAVSELIRKVQSGEDVSGEFYADAEDYLKSIDRVVCTNFTWTREEDGFHIRGYAYCGSQVTPEFQFSLWNPSEEKWEIRQAFSESDQLWIPEEETAVWEDPSGGILVRVEARDSAGKTDGAGDAAAASTTRYYEEEIH